jgi:hypothetical protein
MTKNTFDPNHSAHIVELTNVRPHSNADRLQLATVLNTTIVVGSNAKNGDKGIYFQSGLQLEHEFAKANDLIRRKNPETGKNEGGMFDDNCKVRTQAFRGEKSDGFFIELGSLYKYGVDMHIIDKLKIGDYFETIDGKPLCKKWIPKTLKGKSGPGPNGAKAAKKALYPLFKEHFDTVQSRFVMDQFEPKQHVVITEKLHGTSQRFSHTLTKEKIKGIRKLVSKIFNFPDFEYKWVDIVGTRRVILDSLEKMESGFHGATLRQKASQPFYGMLYKGETVYYEVVGYESEDRPIMGTYDNSKVSKEFKQIYGKNTVFSYGCEPGESDIYVYRITVTTPDGYQVDLPWEEVKKRCDTIGVKYVPELFSGPISNLGRMGDILLGEGDQKLEQSLTAAFDDMASGLSFVDSRHLKEGICIRIDGLAQPKVFKHKSFEFKVLEGILNPETASDSVEEEL